jgi:hypothetical protein
VRVRALADKKVFIFKQLTTPGWIYQKHQETNQPNIHTYERDDHECSGSCEMKYKLNLTNGKKCSVFYLPSTSNSMRGFTFINKRGENRHNHHHNHTHSFVQLYLSVMSYICFHPHEGNEDEKVFFLLFGSNGSHELNMSHYYQHIFHHLGY